MEQETLVSPGKPRIYLVGMPGSGKSTVAALLAMRLTWQCLDTDNCVIAHSCMSVAEMFAVKGEAAFRKQESDCLLQASRMHHAVIATGGGAPLFYGGMERMLSTGIVVYLETDVHILLERTASIGATRPLLASADSPQEALRKLYEERAAVYALAHHTVPTNGLSPGDVTEGILQRIKVA